MIPTSVLLAGFAMGALVMYLAVNLAVDIASERVLPQTVFYLAWGVLVLVGIWRRSRLAWRVGYVMSAISATVGAIGGAVFLCLYLRNLFAYSVNGNFFWLALWFLLAAIYMYTIYYLLRRPTSLTYFAGTERTKKGRKRGHP